MKLIQTEEYLLLIDEEAEIKEGGYAYQINYEKTNSQIIKIESDSQEKIANDKTGSFTKYKIIAYYPLTAEAKELDLPWLPNPFEGEVNIEDLFNKYENGYYSYKENKRIAFEHFTAGYKAAQSKQFSLDDMKKAFNTGKKHIYECEANGKDKKCYCRNDNDCNQRSYLTAEEYVQSLSTQQLPKEFEPEYETKVLKYIPYPKEMEVKGQSWEVGYPVTGKVLKTITNSESKEELVGTYNKNNLN